MKKLALTAFAIISLINLPCLYSQQPDTIQASSEKDNNTAALAFDNDPATRWESQWEDNQFLQFSFDKPTKLAGLDIQWEAASALTYSVDTLNDSGRWITITRLTNLLEGSLNRVWFPSPVKATKFRITCSERLTEFGFSIISIKFLNGSDKPGKIKTRFTIDFPVSGKYFTVRKDKDKYWFFDPDGKPFISRGINAILENDGAVLPDSQYYNVTAKYKNKQDWADSALDRLKKWGFNTIGSWSDPVLFGYNRPFVEYLHCTVSQVHRLVDVFDPGFASNADKRAKNSVLKFKGAEYLIGYFLDNELPWWGDYGWYTGHASYLLDEYMKLKPGTPGKKTAVLFLKNRYADVKEFNKAWQTSLTDLSELTNVTQLSKSSRSPSPDRNTFAGLVAENFLKVWTEAIRKYDPDHLILGMRFAGQTPAPVIVACGKYCDVVSLNYYCKSMRVDSAMIDNFFFRAQKPVMITEFSYRAMENTSGDENNRGADVTVQSQVNRAQGFEKYVKQIISLPYMTGYHWFEYFDQSPQGRAFDGENSDYGIVDINDNEYTNLAKKMTEINTQVEGLHLKSQAAYPTNAIPSQEDSLNNLVEVEKSANKRQGPMTYCDFTTTVLTPWSDTSETGAFMNPGVENNTGLPAINMDFSAGTGWGCGCSIGPTGKYLNADGTGDFSGTRSLRIVISVPKKMPYQIFINESGADNANKESYKGFGKADGESFTSEILTGTGALQEIVLPFDSFSVRAVYGNQKGNHIVNLSAIKGMDVYIPGGSGSGKIEIRKIVLE